MIKFDGLVIKVEPDYKDRIEKGIEIDELWCEVYQETDTEFKHPLGDFNMMQGFEYKEATVEDIESGIKKMVETDWSSYQLEIKTLELGRMKELLRTRHIDRLRVGECGIEAGFVWSDLITNMERVSDHCSNIAGCIIEISQYGALDMHKYIADIRHGSEKFEEKYNEFKKEYVI